MVVEPAPVVPGQEDRRRLPSRTAHPRIDHLRDVLLPGADAPRRMLADAAVWDHPGDRGQPAPPRGRVVVAQRGDVAELVVLLDRLEIRKGVPDPGRLRVLEHVAADEAAGLAVGLRALEEAVAPADVELVKEVRE